MPGWRGTHSADDGRRDALEALARSRRAVAKDRGPVVLVADDDGDARRLLEDLLVHRGYLTIAVGSGHAAWLLARSVHPAVIVCELYLPAATGECLTRVLRRDGALRLVPLVVHSAFVLPADVAWAAEAPVDVFLPKPTPPHEIAAVIEAVAGPPFRARGGRA